MLLLVMGGLRSDDIAYDFNAHDPIVLPSCLALPY